jgi:guanylate kinase
MEGRCVIFSAPSGAGKTTIVHRLLASDLGLAFSVSATSRPRRHTEVDGRDYHFLSPEAFRARVDAGEFVEWEEVYPGQFYGTLRSEVEDIWDRGMHAIFDVDVIGGLKLKESFGDKALAVFVKPPSVEALEVRLRSRRTESDEQIRRRLAKAEHELSFEPRFDIVIVNDDLERASFEAVQHVRAFLAS